MVWYTVKAFSPLREYDFLFPWLDQVTRELVANNASFLRHAALTLEDAILGFLIANAIAMVISVSFLYLPWLEDFITPWTVVLKNIPFVAIASWLIVAGGDSVWPRLVIIVLICFFPIQANVTKGLKSADPVLLDRMKILNASEWQTFRKVRWPAALAYYIAALEISLTGAIIGAIVAQWMFPRQGLGYMIIAYQQRFRMDGIFAVVVWCSVLSILAQLSAKIIEVRAFHWKAQNN